MKRLLLLTALAVCAPIVGAQEVAPTQTELAQINPAARDLLARTATRYQKLETFECLTIRQSAPLSDGKALRSRVQLTREGKFVLGVTYPNKSWLKWIYDGKTLVKFRSGFPKSYHQESHVFPAYFSSSHKIGTVIEQLGVGQFDTLPLSMVTSDYPARLLLSPDLAGVEMQIEGEGELKVISIRRRPSRPGFSSSALKLWINPFTLMIERSALYVDDALYSIELYEEIRFDPTFAASLFRAVAPKGYTRIIPYKGEVSVSIVNSEDVDAR